MYLFLLLLKKRMQNVAVILKTIDGIWGGGMGKVEIVNTVKGNL